MAAAAVPVTDDNDDDDQSQNNLLLVHRLHWPSNDKLLAVILTCLYSSMHFVSFIRLPQLINVGFILRKNYYNRINVNA